MRSRACAGVGGGLGRGAALSAAFERFLPSLCSRAADACVGMVMTFQRIPPPFSVTSMAVNACVPSG